MKTYAAVLILALVVGVVALVGQVVHAQAPAAAEPALDAATKEIVSAWVQQDQALGKALQARVDAMMKTPEGQAYQAALKERQDAQARINAQMVKKIPGYGINFQTGKVQAIPPQQAAAK